MESSFSDEKKARENEKALENGMHFESTKKGRKPNVESILQTAAKTDDDDGIRAKYMDKLNAVKKRTALLNLMNGAAEISQQSNATTSSAIPEAITVTSPIVNEETHKPSLPKRIVIAGANEFLVLQML
jgi:hypothetical protein